MPSGPDDFAKDFGYLWPFFDRVAAADERPALHAAVADARAACERIAALLAGDAEPSDGAGDTPASASPVAAAPTAADVPPPASPEGAVPASLWTVGPLHPQDLGNAS